MVPARIPFLFLLGAFATQAASVTLTGSAFTLDSFSTPSTQGIWDVNLTMVASCALGCPSSLVFTDTSGDVLGGTGNRMVRLSILNGSSDPLHAIPVGVFGASYSTMGSSNRLPSYRLGHWIYFRTDILPGITPVLPGETLIVELGITSPNPVSMFSLNAAPNSDAIPEPSTLALTGLAAAVGFTRLLRRSRR